MLSFLQFFSQLRSIQDLQTVQIVKILRYEKKVAIMFFLMISCFLVCWTPYAAVSMVEAFGRRSQVSPRLAIIPSFFAKSSTAYNPLIYMFMSRKVCGSCSYCRSILQYYFWVGFSSSAFSCLGHCSVHYMLQSTDPFDGSVIICSHTSVGQSMNLNKYGKSKVSQIRDNSVLSTEHVNGDEHHGLGRTVLLLSASLRLHPFLSCDLSVLR